MNTHLKLMSGLVLSLSAACILIDIVISYHYTQIVEFGVLLKS